MNDTAGNRTLVLDTAEGLNTVHSPSRDLLFDFIFDDAVVREYVRSAAEREATTFVDPNVFCEFCRRVVGTMPAEVVEAPVRDSQIARLERYIAETNRVTDRFNPHNKPNPGGLFWPDPTRGGPQLADVLPIAERYPFIDQSTIIASAGSCFAVEIAQNLIQRGFNYLALEKTFDPATGTLVMETDPENPIVQYTCRWGILFNTPSFTQIAEHAFGVRSRPNILVKLGTPPNTFYSDPFREAVIFPSVEAYEAEQKTHLANTREAFLKAEVFILTLGLNEAWRYLPDGSYISRNPRNRAMIGLLDHRTLTVEENVECLQRFIDIVRAHNSGIKFIVTVSPVPFLATGRSAKYHVVTANCHSKAVLRVAAEEIVERNKDVFYFPSYEVVTVCSPTIWTEDQRHIDRSAVARVMDTFDEMFLTRGAKTVLRLRNAQAAGS